MTLPVTDARSNSNDQIAYVAKVLGRAKDRTAVFLYIHTGKKRIKTATEIARATRLRRKRVLEEGKKLVHKEVVKQHAVEGDIGYERDSFCYAHRAKIVALAKSPTRLKSFPTKYSPAAPTKRIVIATAKSFIRTATITIDAIDSFANVKGHRTATRAVALSESQIKAGFKKILGETGRFKDWGGETSDLWTTRLRLKGKRVTAAIAFK